MKILGQIKNYTILKRESDFQPYVAAYLFDEKTETWAQGHYFFTFEEACTFAITRRTELLISYNRLEEIATNALDWIHSSDIDEISDFDENYSLDLTSLELDYFGI